jgi:hypothetical protein
MKWYWIEKSLFLISFSLVQYFWINELQKLTTLVKEFKKYSFQIFWELKDLLTLKPTLRTSFFHYERSTQVTPSDLLSSVRFFETNLDLTPIDGPSPELCQVLRSIWYMFNFNFFIYKSGFRYPCQYRYLDHSFMIHYLCWLTIRTFQAWDTDSGLCTSTVIGPLFSWFTIRTDTLSKFRQARLPWHRSYG